MRRDPSPAVAPERGQLGNTGGPRRAPAPPGGIAPCGFNVCGLNLQPQGAASYKKLNGKCTYFTFVKVLAPIDKNGHNFCCFDVCFFKKKKKLSAGDTPNSDGGRESRFGLKPCGDPRGVLQHPIPPGFQGSACHPHHHRGTVRDNVAKAIGNFAQCE